MNKVKRKGPQGAVWAAPALPQLSWLWSGWGPGRSGVPTEQRLCWVLKREWECRSLQAG